MLKILSFHFILGTIIFIIAAFSLMLKILFIFLYSLSAIWLKGCNLVRFESDSTTFDDQFRSNF